MDSNLSHPTRRTPQSGFRLRRDVLDMLVLRAAAGGVTLTEVVEASISAYCKPKAHRSPTQHTLARRAA